MKYNELIQFEPIHSVVQLTDAEDNTVAERLVKTYIFSEKIKETLKEVILKNLNPIPKYDTKGIQIVGSYGTGKSHLLSVIYLIARDSSFLQYITDDEMKKDFQMIAGRYNVLRIDTGNLKSLNEIIFSRLNEYLKKIDTPYEFDPNSNYSWKEQILDMMAHFEEKYPDKHFLIVIDELLEFLKSKQPTDLNRDLMFLRQIGEACNNSRFKFIFGVQELLYRSPEFQFQAEMLNKVEDRYSDLIITKEDVSFVVKERLLKKDLSQKAKIRDHLLKFSHLFEGINSKLNEFVDLFPVHPSYISHFSMIKYGKHQREILKVLSQKFEEIGELEIPEHEPGLITIDTYWNELSKNAADDSIGDIREIRDKMLVIKEAIDRYFVSGRKNRKPLAESIVNALAIMILSDDLDKKNGATALSLKEDLCKTIPMIDSSELLTATFETTAKQLVTATSGQYVDEDTLSSKFYIRTEGGINIPQIIKDYSETVIFKEKNIADEYFYNFLQYMLGLNQMTYRTGFKIWEHSLEWLDKKSFRLGYIFFGNPNERSTTEPMQQYYLFYSPLFGKAERNDEQDEVYFDFSDLSKDFKNTICLYGAAKAKEHSAPSNQKKLFQSHIEEYLQKAIGFFTKEFLTKTNVIYRGEKKNFSTFPIHLPEGTPIDLIFSNVAARVLNNYFSDKYPFYPSFKELIQPITKDNFGKMIESAVLKISPPSKSNKIGEAILTGLGLWNGQSIDYQHSRYANTILDKLKSIGDGNVLNNKEILYCHYAGQKLYYSIDFDMEYQFLFLVLSCLVYNGEIEIVWTSQRTLTATNIDKLSQIPIDDYYTFTSIKKPTGIPVKALIALFDCLGLPNLYSDIEKPETITSIVTNTRQILERVLLSKQLLIKGLKCRNISLLNESSVEEMKIGLEKLSTLLDGILIYDSYGKLKNFKYTENELKETFLAYKHCETIKKLKEKADKFDRLISYLHTAHSYIVSAEQPLYEDIEKAIQRLPEVLNSNQKNEETRYETLLNSLIEKYADYYIKQYNKCRLSVTDNHKKERLLESDKKKLCDILKDIDIITPTKYQNWINSILSLKPIDPSITHELVKQEPYHDFNPREFYGKPNYRIEDLSEELDTIFEQWSKAIHSIFKDPSIKDNLVLLNDSDKTLIERLMNGSENLNLQNAQVIRKLILDLTKGLDKVEVNISDIQKEFHKPMDPDEAIQAFQTFINSLCLGKERNKVRIIFK